MAMQFVKDDLRRLMLRTEPNKLIFVEAKTPDGIDLLPGMTWNDKYGGSVETDLGADEVEAWAKETWTADTKPPWDVINDETGEVLLDASETIFDQFPEPASKEDPEEEDPEDSEPSWEPEAGSDTDLKDQIEKYYDVAWESFADKVDDPEYLRDHDYDVEIDVPVSVRRKDKQKFTDEDVVVLRKWTSLVNKYDYSDEKGSFLPFNLQLNLYISTGDEVGEFDVWFN